MIQRYIHFWFGLLLLTLSGTVLAIEEPSYTVLEQADAFELRRYEPKIVAETLVSGSMDSASGGAFKLLAGYIFGDNTARTGGNETISMTAPVTLEPRSQQINMTSPVTLEQAGGQWRVHFVMPAQYTMATLPKPNNPAVTLRQIPAVRYAVVRFSGFTGEAKVAQKTAELMAWMKTKGLRPAGAAELSRYNPPWTLPFLRRNEVMIRY